MTGSFLANLKGGQWDGPGGRGASGSVSPSARSRTSIAAGAALIAAFPLVRLGRGHNGRVFALSVYVSCVIAALAISGVYHSLAEGGRARLIMQRLDYFAIWMLIAGTFTAIHGLLCRGFWRGGLLCIIWGYAIVGVLLQLLWWQRFSGHLGLMLYLGLGWIGLPVGHQARAGRSATGGCCRCWAPGSSSRSEPSWKRAAGRWCWTPGSGPTRCSTSRSSSASPPCGCSSAGLLVHHVARQARRACKK